MVEENQAAVTDKYQNAKTDNELIEVENTYWYELYKSLERLKKNRDFKKLIMEKLIAISSLQDYFILIEQRAVKPEAN